MTPAADMTVAPPKPSTGSTGTSKPPARANKPLAIVPNYATKGEDIEVLATCLRTMRETVGDALEIAVIDDGSPDAELVVAAGKLASKHDAAFVAKAENEGFSHTVNVGLRRALSEDRDAILVNADIEFFTKTWLDLMLRQRSWDKSKPASIVGALLFYPTGLIQHAGVFFSVLYREFDHIYRYGPRDLPEAREARECPVTGALMFIRHECLVDIGVYDEDFRLGWEDVDYCVRAWQAGHSIVMQPGVQAVHHESFFRGRPSKKIAAWQRGSWLHFCTKHNQTSFAEFVPALI